MSAERRLQQIARHLGAPAAPVVFIGPVSNTTNVDVARIRCILDGDTKDIRDTCRALIDREPIFRDTPDAPDDELQEMTYLQTKKLADQRIVPLVALKEDPAKFYAMFEAMSFFSFNIAIKMVVQWSLFGGTLLFLGTERHRKYIPGIEAFKTGGCFAMTEIGHGSNVRGLETTATYDPATREFIIHSPSITASKFWIGNAAKHAHYASVFARLILGSKDLGIHCFVVPIRDTTTKEPLPGVTLTYCGHKMGLNGVDNGNIQFYKVRIPRENMLNRFSDVTEDGKYVSQFDSPAKNFGATMSALVSGRLVIGCTVVSSAKVGVAIAVGFAFSRRQFGPQGNEITIINYPSIQRRLIPALARTYVYDFALKHYTSKYQRNEAGTTEIHAHCAGFKATAAWHCTQSLQFAREIAGGQGYRAQNRISEFRVDTDIATTFEGDNMVLMQSVTKFLLGQYLAEAKHGKGFTGVLAHLVNKSTPVLDESLVDDLAAHVALFQFRERVLLKQFAKAMRDEDNPNAFNENMGLALAVAHSHMDLQLIQIMQATVNQYPDVPVFRRLYNLDVMWRIEEDLGWFVSHGAVAPELGKCVPAIMYQRSRDLAPLAPALVEAFGIPRKCLPANPELIN